MGAIGEKLQAAGFNSFEAAFAKLAFDALKAHPHSVVDAWHFMGDKFGFAYLRDRMKDMKIEIYDGEKSVPTFLSTGRTIPGGGSKPYRPRIRPTAEEIKVRQNANRRKMVELLFGYKMIDGRDWAEVGAHELKALKRQGGLAAEVEKELPELSGNMCFANLRELITAKQFAAARERAGCYPRGLTLSRHKQ